MVKIINRQRKSPILTPSSIPCLNRLPTINITEGCAHSCTYCYTQSYSNYPGQDHIVLFENTADVVREELPRKRRKPQRVYFSPSSDAFQFLPEVQEVTYQTMSALLEADVEIAFLTKGFIEDRFLKLFATKPQLIFAQIGITTLDKRVWNTFEPRSASPEQRIESIRNLLEIGAQTTARLDPLIPELTDTVDNSRELLSSLHKADIKRASVSFLFLRPIYTKRVLQQLEEFGIQSSLISTWRHQPFINGCGGGRTLPAQDRVIRFRRLVEQAQQYNIEVIPCRCKNPELGGQGCQIAGTYPLKTQEPVQQLLFD
ncbi:MAG: SPL family radical SAM protein [Planctomycetota bacterium]|jgi:DNA repair photolyase